jgi:hypothetical protein
MNFKYGKAGALGAAGCSEESHAWRLDASEHTLTQHFRQAPRSAASPIRAELTGSDTCTAAGVTVTAYAPELVLCRSLIAAGMSPDQAMECWRGSMLCLRIRSIGEAAGLEIAGDGVGFRPARLPDAAPPMRRNGRAAP